MQAEAGQSCISSTMAPRDHASGAIASGWIHRELGALRALPLFDRHGHIFTNRLVRLYFRADSLAMLIRVGMAHSFPSRERIDRPVRSCRLRGPADLVRRF